MQTGEERQAEAQVVPSGVGLVEGWTAPPTWARSVTLRREDVELNRLPGLCVATGEPTAQRLTRRWTSTPRGIPALAFFGLLPYLVAWALTKKSVTGSLPVSASRLARFRIAQAAGTVPLLLIPLGIVLGLFNVGGLGTPPAPERLGELDVALLVIGLGILVLAHRSIGFSYRVHDDGSMEIFRAHPAFVAAATQLHWGEAPPPLAPSRGIGAWRVIVIALTAVAMMVLAGISSTAQPSVSSASAASATQFNDPDGHFTAAFIGQPVKQVQAAQNSDTGSVVWEAVTPTTDESVLYAHYIAAPDVDTALGSAIQASASALGGTVIGQQRITYQGLPAVQGTIRLPNGSYLEAVYAIDGQSLFGVIAVGREDPPADFQRFSSSVKIVGP